MANTKVFQGVLNRILTSVQVISNPSLNVTAGYFGQKQATLTPETPASDYIENLAGATQSPRPYQVMGIMFYLNKSQSLAQAWEIQRAISTNIGDINITTDSPVLGPYYISNCTLLNINELSFDGQQNDFPVLLRGTYYINSHLFG